MEHFNEKIMKNATEWKDAFYDNELPVIWVDFPIFKGKSFLNSLPTWAPIFFSRTFLDKMTCSYSIKN